AAHRAIGTRGQPAHLSSLHADLARAQVHPVQPCRPADERGVALALDVADDAGDRALHGRTRTIRAWERREVAPPGHGAVTEGLHARAFPSVSTSRPSSSRRA